MSNIMETSHNNIPAISLFPIVVILTKAEGRVEESPPEDSFPPAGEDPSLRSG